MLPIVAAGQKTLGWSDSPWHRRLFSMSNQRKILDLPGRWWCRDDSDELLPCAMTSGGNVGNFIIQSFPLFSPDSYLFWQGRGGSRWFWVTYINIKSGLRHFFFSIFTCIYNLFSCFLLIWLNGTLHEERGNNIFRTLCAGTVGDFEGTQARWETLQCQKCKYKSSQCRFIGDRLSYDR